MESSANTRKEALIAAGTLLAILLHLALRYGRHTEPLIYHMPLWAAFVFGGVPLVWQLTIKLFRREFGSDLLAGISIVVSVLLEEYLAGALVILMLSGGETLEAYAVRSASSVLQALARRMPSTGHRLIDSKIVDVALEDIQVGDQLMIMPHEICPVDGTVIEGHSVMDESYLTGEPYLISKTPGATVISGAINGDAALSIQADQLAVDSRYAKIMEVMKASEQHRPRLRRLGDRLGAVYTPIALAIALIAWLISGDPVRFLAVLVVATPCPLLIAIPVAIIGSISLAAKRAIIIRDPSALEKVDTCRTILFDKTGTLTYGQPELTERLTAPGINEDDVLSWVASLEQYSKHPLSVAIIQAGKQEGAPMHEVSAISERPGEGLKGSVLGKEVRITSRAKLQAEQPEALSLLPPESGGLECVVLVDGHYAATFCFRDKPRKEGASFIQHLKPRHEIDRIMLLSGDRESEVRYLADLVGVREVHASKSPEEKLAIVREETDRARTIFVGDGINDAPALVVSTVGIALGQKSDVTTEAADVVIMDSSLQKVDEFMHISRRMRRIALQSALGGMALSVVGMLVAAAGYLPPIAGALFQEVIDVAAVLNALRAAWAPKKLTDYQG